MKEFDVTTAYGKMHIYQKGTGKRKVVLLHGSGCDNAMLSWAEAVEQFGDEYTVYAPDLLGYGKSDKPDNMCGESFYPIHIRSVNQLMKSLGAEKFILCGLSMGGAIAIGYALQYPAQVELLVPVDAWGISPVLPFQRFSYWYIHKTNMTLSQYKWIAKSRLLAKWFIGYSLIGDKRKITDAMVDEVLRACKEDNAGKAMQDYQRSSCSRNGAIPYYKDELFRLTMPVLFVHGELDPLVPVSHLDGVKELLPHGDICILKGCKHWSVKERPEEFVRLIQSKTEQGGMAEDKKENENKGAETDHEKKQQKRP